MIKLIISTLALSGQIALANLETDNIIGSTGVLAHKVLSSTELAKIKHFEINKAIAIEKLKEKISVTSTKLTEINTISSTSIEKIQKSNYDAEYKVNELNLIAGVLSDTTIWARDVGDKVVINQHFNEIKEQYKQLKILLKNTIELREKTEGLIGLYSFEKAVNNEIKRTSQKAEIINLLNAKEEEIRELVKKELFKDGFNHNVYYITAANMPIDKDIQLLKTIFSSVKERDDIKINITGRADPRGGKKYNELLAKNRALNIEKIAIDAGVNKNLISVNSYISDVKIEKNKELHFFDRNTSISITLDR